MIGARCRFGGVFASGLLLAGCSNAPPGDQSSPSPSGPSETVAPSEIVEPTETATVSPSENPDAIEDGRHPTWVTAIDTAGRTLTVDVIQFLTGQAAIDAYHSEFPDDPDGPPNDYWIVNENPRLRTIAVADDAAIELLEIDDDIVDLEPATWDGFEGYLDDASDEEGRLDFSPYWLTVEDGVIVAIEEQYLP